MIAGFNGKIRENPGKNGRVDRYVLLTYQEETKQPRRPIAGLPLLEFSPALESWSDIYTGPTSCLIVPQMFSSFVFYLPSLSFCRSARLFTVHWTAWVDTPLTADWLQVCFGTRPRLSFLKRFWKIAYPAFKWPFISLILSESTICNI